MIDALALSFSAFATGFSLNWLLWSLWHRRQVRIVTAEAYQRGQLEGYRAREVSELRDAIEQARLVGLRTEVPRWEAKR